MATETWNHYSSFSIKEDKLPMVCFTNELPLEQSTTWLQSWHWDGVPKHIPPKNLEKHCPMFPLPCSVLHASSSLHVYVQPSRITGPSEKPPIEGPLEKSIGRIYRERK